MNRNEAFETATAALWRTMGAEPIYSRSEDGNRLDAVRLPTGQTVAWRLPESCDPTRSGDESHFVTTAIAAVAAASCEVAKVGADPNLSQMGKTAKTAAHWSEAEARISEIAAKAEAEAKSFEKYQAGFNAPPRAADAVEQLADSEVRTWINSLPAEALPQLARDLLEGKQTEVLTAVMRSPIPMPPALAAVAQDAWTRHLERTQLDAVRLVRERADRVTWAREIVGQVQAAIPKAAQGVTHRAA